MEPIKIMPPTYCRICGKYSIDLYNVYNSPIGYNNILNRNTKSNILKALDNNKSLSYMKCKNCGKVFYIDWTQKIPRPLYDEREINKIKSGKLF